MSNLDSLFSPLKLGTMELPNRIVMAPMTVDYGEQDETPSDRQIAYYRERAAGGVGLVALEALLSGATAGEPPGQDRGLARGESGPAKRRTVTTIAGPRLPRPPVSCRCSPPDESRCSRRPASTCSSRSWAY